MLNFGLEDLRIVSPKFSLDNEKILPLAAGADIVVKNTKVYESFEDSVKDINFLIAFTARKRTFTKITTDIPKAIIEINKNIQSDNKVGLVFGPENSGLNNIHLTLVDRIILIKTNQQFSSINLSHSVILFCYEWFVRKEMKKKSYKEKKIENKTLATKEELLNFFLQLENKLEKSGFIKTEERKLTITSKLRNIFNRIDLTKNEILTLMGIINSIDRKK